MSPSNEDLDRPTIVAVLCVRSDTLYCSFQARSWREAIGRALGEANRQQHYIREGTSDAVVAVVHFSERDGRGVPYLETHKILDLRRDAKDLGVEVIE